MGDQIPFSLAKPPEPSFDNFIESPCNRAALLLVRTPAQWPAPVLLLQGLADTGKTHLGLAFETAGLGTLIDDADRVDAGVLFAAINSALTGEGPPLLLTSRLPAPDWPQDMPDLRSRLKNTANVRLEDPDDALLEAILRKAFDDRGRVISRDVVIYLISRTERSISGLQDLAVRLDDKAQSEKADITKAYAARYLSTRS